MSLLSCFQHDAERRVRGRHRRRAPAIAVLLFALFASGCELEIDHLFNEDGSSTYQIALGDEIDEEEDESLTCDSEAGDIEDGFLVEYSRLEQRGAQTWCTTGVRMESPSHLASYYRSLNSGGEVVRINCLDVVDGQLFYDIDLLLEVEEGELEPEDRITWRVTAPHDIATSNADLVNGDTASWDLTNRSGLVPLRVGPTDTTCPTPGFLLNITATSETSGTASIETRVPSSDETEIETFVSILANSGWEGGAAGGMIQATRLWDDPAQLQALAASLPMIPGSEFAISSEGGVTEFDAHLDLSFYESFWQGLNPDLDDPSFRLRWTPLPGPVSPAGDWSDSAALTFDWTVDTQGRVFGMSTTTEVGAVSDDGSADDSDEDEYGVIERDGKLFVNSRPGEILSLNRSDLPIWAAYLIATQGARAIGVGPPDTIAAGDPTILIDGAPIARLGDVTLHGGSIVTASDRIFANGVPVAVLGSHTVDPMVTGVVPHVGGPIFTTGATAAGDLERRETKITEEALALGMELYDEILQIEVAAIYAEVQELEESILQLDADAAKGDTRLDVDGSGVSIGDGIAIGNRVDTQELAKVAGKGSIILDRPLEHDHPAGSYLTVLPAEATRLIPDPPVGAITDADDSLGSPLVLLIAVAALLGLGVIGLGLRRKRRH